MAGGDDALDVVRRLPPDLLRIVVLHHGRNYARIAASWIAGVPLTQWLKYRAAAELAGLVIARPAYAVAIDDRVVHAEVARGVRDIADLKLRYGFGNLRRPKRGRLTVVVGPIRVDEGEVLMAPSLAVTTWYDVAGAKHPMRRLRQRAAGLVARLRRRFDAIV